MLIESLKKMAEDFRNAKRQYASFFSAPRKYRSEQELSIVQHVYASLETENIHYSCKINKNDPPDIIVKESTGATFGVEVTELVSQNGIEAQIKEDRPTELREMLGWTDEKIVREISWCIKQKGCVSKNVVDCFDRYVLVIHTDEVKLTYDRLVEAVHNIEWPDQGLLDEAYLLFSYDPSKKSYPILKLF